MPPALRATLLGLAVAAVFGLSARAQHPLVPHARPLHERLALADVIAAATVEDVKLGRIRVGSVRRLAGDVPERFEIKRAPSSPPPLEAGDRALFLLRGARPPYVLVDQPDETIRLADPAAEARWTAAVEALLRLHSRPAEWPALYVSWVREGPDTLRGLAVQGLTDPAAPFQPLRPALYEQLGRAAWDEGWSLPARRAAALLAIPSREGCAALVAGFLAAPAGADSLVAQAAVRGASRQQDPRRDEALLAGLAHPDAELRRVALREIGADATKPGPAVRERVEQLAAEDPEPWLREDAKEALVRIGATP